MSGTDWYLALLAGFVLDLLFGDPAWRYHPVCLIGRYIAWCEKRLRARGGNLRRSAVVLTASTVAVTMASAAALVALASLWGRVPRLVVMALMNWLGLSARCLAKEAEGVRQALARGVEAGRTQVARIVGRDTAELTEAEIIAATVETVAENTTDGVVAPMLYGFLGGPVLLWGFKAASTLDSMVGYMDPKYRDIGWSSARLDDVLNYLPARLTGPLMCLAAGLCRLDIREAWRILRRDHACHKSPNCAWSEAAAAGALGIRLGGTHQYFGKTVVKPAIGDDTRPIQRQDIRRVNRMMYITALLAMALLGVLTLVIGGIAG